MKIDNCITNVMNDLHKDIFKKNLFIFRKDKQIENISHFNFELITLYLGNKFM